MKKTIFLTAALVVSSLMYATAQNGSKPGEQKPSTGSHVNDGPRSGSNEKPTTVRTTPTVNTTPAPAPAKPAPSSSGLGERPTSPAPAVNDGSRATPQK